MADVSSEIELFLQEFEDYLDQAPREVGPIFGNQTFTFEDINNRSNQLAAYLQTELKIRPGSLIGILGDKSISLVIMALSLVKCKCTYFYIDPVLPVEHIKELIKSSKIEVVISSKKYIKSLNKLQWECKLFNTYLCIDTDDVFREDEIGKNKLMNQKLWEIVAYYATDDITGGGWVNSYTRENFSKEEMNEYAENIFAKLKPYLGNDKKVLEIGCSSGISMFKIAPYVGLYFAIDLSRVTIEKNQQKMLDKNIKNIRLYCLPAHELEQLNERNFDIVIMNSVTQCFHGHNYLRAIIMKTIQMMSEQGIIFIGDIMDQELKSDLYQSLIEFKKQNPHYNTKTNLSEELYLSQGFFEDLQSDIQEIKKTSFSRKIYTIPNELTKYRYDLLMEINKRKDDFLNKITKHKNQYGVNILK